MRILHAVRQIKGDVRFSEEDKERCVPVVKRMLGLFNFNERTQTASSEKEPAALTFEA